MLLRPRVRAVPTLVLVAMVLGSPSPLRGQITVFPLQDLGFGNVQAGSSETVLTSDAPRRAELEVRAAGRVTITVGFPSQMTSVSGDRVPLLFTSADGRYRRIRSGREFDFDPTTPTPIRIPRRQGGIVVYLGGTALPAASQPAGAYSATITVQISRTGT